MWPRRLVAALPPETIDAAIASLLRTGVTPADVTLLAPATLTLYRDVRRGLRVRSGRRVLARREATAIGGLAGALIGALVVLTLGAMVAHLPAGAVPLPVRLPPRELGGFLVSYVWIYGAIAGALLGTPLGAGRGMPATLARRFDDSLARGQVLVAVRPRRGSAPRVRAALQEVGAHTIRLCYGDLHAVGMTRPNPAAPEDDPRRWPG